MHWRALAGLLVLAAALAWLSGASLSAQIEARARSEAQLYAAGGSPFSWDFSAADAIVGPPQGIEIEARSEHGLRLRLPEGQGDLGLRLSGRRIDPAALPQLEIAYRSEHALQLRIAAAADLSPRMESGTPLTLPAGQHVETLNLGPLLPTPAPQTLAQLRLRLQGERGQTLTIEWLRLRPADCGNPPCLPARLELQPLPFGAAALAARDALRESQPQALIGTPALEPLVQASQRLQTASSGVLAALGALALGLGAALRRADSNRAHSLSALLLGAALPLALLALGLPRFPAESGDALLLGGLAVALWWARPRGHQITPGPALPAWRQALAFTAITTLALLLVALASEAAPRWPAADRVLRYAAFAVLQQLWLARFVLPHLRRLQLGGSALPAAALLFAGLHLPNLELMALTALSGLAWVSLAARHGRFWPQTVSHLLLGLAAMALLPPALLRSLEVGGRYVFAPL